MNFLGWDGYESNIRLVIYMYFNTYNNLKYLNNTFIILSILYNTLNALNKEQ